MSIETNEITENTVEFNLKIMIALSAASFVSGAMAFMIGYWYASHSLLIEGVQLLPLQ